MWPTREEAWELLREYTSSENLLRHALAVEAALAYYARYFGEDEERWRVVGLLHDFDYEKFPDPSQHVHEGMKILHARGYDEKLIRAIASHADYMGIPRESLMEKALYAVDELTGFIIAVALVRPSKKLADVTVKSVKKKFKDKAFARGVNREALFKGAEALGIPMDEHIQHVLEALQGIHDSLGV